MKALRAAVVALLALAPAGAVERAIPAVSLPSAPPAAAVAMPELPALSPALTATAPLPGAPSYQHVPEHVDIPALPQATAATRVAGDFRSGAEAPPEPFRASGASRASAALAAIAEFAAKAPPASASLEDSAAHARSLAGLMITEPVRGPPRASRHTTDEGPETGVVRVADLGAALSALRAASHPRHADTDALVSRLAAQHPGLPLDADHVFLVKDGSVLPAYGVPPAAAGAARIVSDGRREAKIVILVAGRGVALDDFVEYSIHEAVHLADDSILRIGHERFVEHLFAEGWTQLRAHDMANESLRALGRPQRPNGAYSQEVALARAFIADYGEAPLRELVERGSDAGLRRALGPRWDGLLALSAQDPASAVRQREYFLKLIEVVLAHPEFGPLDFRNASRALHGAPRS